MSNGQICPPNLSPTEGAPEDRRLWGLRGPEAVGAWEDRRLPANTVNKLSPWRGLLIELVLKQGQRAAAGYMASQKVWKFFDVAMV